MALEAGSSAQAIVRIIKPHVARVVVANTKELGQISHAKAKTDTLDTPTLCGCSPREPRRLGQPSPSVAR